MSAVKDLLEGYKLFHSQYFSDGGNPLYKESLAFGQKPESLIIACCDSRVDPAIVTNAIPGQIFVVRSVANLVPTYSYGNAKCCSVVSAIEFAVLGVKVKNIIVMGHSCCVGMQSFIDDEFAHESAAYKWMSSADVVKKKANTLSGNNRYTTAEQLSVKLSLDNLMTFPCVRSSVDESSLNLIGWHFCVKTGELKVYNREADAFERVKS